VSLIHRIFFPSESRKIEELEEKVKLLESSIVKIVGAINNTTGALEKIALYIAEHENERDHTNSRRVPIVSQTKKEYIN